MSAQLFICNCTRTSASGDSGFALLPARLDLGDDLLDGDLSPPGFVIRPFFPRGELTEIVGAHGAFKSTIALDACLAVATGRAWGNVPTTQGRAVFITLEDSAQTLARRVRAWLRGIFEPGEITAAERDVRSNLAFLARERAQSVTLTATRDGSTSARLDVAEHVAGLVTGASLVVLETVSRLHDGPETNDAFAALVRALERIIVMTGAALVLVRHMSKKDAREMRADEVTSYAGRGGAALSDAARSVLVVVRNRSEDLGSVSLVAAKTTHAREGGVLAWRPTVVEDLEAVRLVPMKGDEQVHHDAQLLLAHFAALGRSGITHTDLHHNPPRGLGRGRTDRALRVLLASGQVVMEIERRGRTKQKARVYYLANHERVPA